MRRAAGFLAAFACFAATVVFAGETEEAAGIPAYSVARLTVLDGSVWVRTEADGDWEEFSTNSPIPPATIADEPEKEALVQATRGSDLIAPFSSLGVRKRLLRDV